MMEQIIQDLTALDNQMKTLMAKLNIDDKATAAQELEQQASQPDFWNTPDNAQQVMQKLSRLKSQVEMWRSVANRISDALELSTLGDDMGDELSAETEELKKVVEKMSLQAMFSGDYDDEDAILAIHAGAGGVDAQDWAQMLERMYMRWIEANNYKYEIIDRSPGDEAGLKSVTISVKGPLAYGWLQSEQGVHRLVRLSPFDSANRRHTSFAKVELWPDIGGNIEIDIKESDLRIDVFRAQGPGGQSVNTTDSAVRITHVPTGIVVQSQNQKSQLQNKDRALQVLKARLFELERKKQEDEIAQLKGDNVDAGWGNQIRSYVLHPYQMVKDHRTNYEVGKTSAVLDGDLNDFMESYLRLRLGETTGE